MARPVCPSCKQELILEWPNGMPPPEQEDVRIALLCLSCNTVLTVNDGNLVVAGPEFINSMPPAMLARIRWEQRQAFLAKARLN